MTPPIATAPEPISRAAWALLLFMTLLNVLNHVDRWLLSGLAPLIIRELGLSKTEIGLLVGFGFVFFYSLVGMFLGVAADRWPRIPLLMGGVALWSAMTAASGLARSFVHLAIPRILVGVGEATLTPAALSMLGDAIPRRRLGLATGVYYAGIPLGTATSLIVAGFVAPRWGWRACFFALGTVGLLAVLALRLFREPARTGGNVAAAHPPLGTLVRDFGRALAERRQLLLVLAGGSCLVFGAGAALHNVTWLVEERGLPFARAAFIAGVMAVTAGFLGNLAGGMFGDWLGRRVPNGRLWSLVAMTLFFVPATALFYLLPAGTPLFFVCWFIAQAGYSSWFGPLFAAIQELSPQHTRSTVVAFALLVMNLLGVGPGPLITGMIGDARDLTSGLVASLGVVAAAIVPFAVAARVRQATAAPAEAAAT